MSEQNELIKRRIEELEEIKNYFSKDWEECKAHSKMSKERLAAASVSQL